jgi:hypothetical protein
MQQTREFTTTIDSLAIRAEEQFGSLEYGKFYDISDWGVEIQAKDGYVPIKHIVKKTGKTFEVTVGSAKVVCSDSHRFVLPNGEIIQAADLSVGTEVQTLTGVQTVTAIEQGQEDDFYDFEVSSPDHLFVTANGVVHHNTGKTQNVEDELAAAGLKDGEGYTVFKGSASTAGLYRAFFQNRNGILFFDDADGALADQDSRNLFKAASDTKKVRKLSWQKAGGGYVDPEDFDFDNEEEQDKLPRSFEFKGKIIFISNLSMNKLDPDGALRTRGYIIPVDPTDQDMIDFMRKIADNIPLDVNYVLDTKDRNEVVDIIASKIQGVDTIKSKILNLRMLVKALNIRAGIESAGGSKQEWVNFVQRFI